MVWLPPTVHAPGSGTRAPPQPLSPHYGRPLHGVAGPRPPPEPRRSARLRGSVAPAVAAPAGGAELAQQQLAGHEQLAGQEQLAALAAARGAGGRWQELHRRRSALEGAEGVDPEERWTIHVEVPPRDERVTLQVRAGAQIQALRGSELAAAAPGVARSLELGAAGSLRLLHDGRLLNDAFTLAQCGLCSDAVLQLRSCAGGRVRVPLPPAAAVPPICPLSPRPPPRQAEQPPPIGGRLGSPRKNSVQVWLRPTQTGTPTAMAAADTALQQATLLPQRPTTSDSAVSV